jgi:hypothetical protein
MKKMKAKTVFKVKKMNKLIKIQSKNTTGKSLRLNAE